MNNVKAATIATSIRVNGYGARLYAIEYWPKSEAGLAWAKAEDDNKPKLSSWWDTLVAFSSFLGDNLEYCTHDNEFMTQPFGTHMGKDLEDESVAETMRGYRAWGQQYVYWARFDVSIFGINMVVEYAPRSPEMFNPEAFGEPKIYDNGKKEESDE